MCDICCSLTSMEDVTHYKLCGFTHFNVKYVWYLQVLGSYPAWPVRIVSFDFDYLEQNWNCVWFLESELKQSLKPDLVLELKPGPKFFSNFFLNWGKMIWNQQWLTASFSPSYLNQELDLGSISGTETGIETWNFVFQELNQNKTQGSIFCDTEFKTRSILLKNSRTGARGSS